MNHPGLTLSSLVGFINPTVSMSFFTEARIIVIVITLRRIAMKNDEHRNFGDSHLTSPDEGAIPLLRRHINLQGKTLLTLSVATLVICLFADTSSERIFNICLFAMISIGSIFWSIRNDD